VVEERREIANKIAELHIDNLVLLHGDTHYLAAGKLMFKFTNIIPNYTSTMYSTPFQ